MCTTHELQPGSTPASVPSPTPMNGNLNNNNNTGIAIPGSVLLPEQLTSNPVAVEESGRRRHRRKHHHRHHHSDRSDRSERPERSERPPRPTREHVMNQVDKILGSVATGNIVGIVDESLKIRASEPTRNLVSGIMNTIFHPVDTLLGRGVKKPSQTNGLSGAAT